VLFKLLGAPVTAPLAGFRFILTQVLELAERETDSEASIRDQLLLLQLQLDEGEITEEEYAEREGPIIARLRAARERRLGLTRADAGEPDR
jgi:hypothetical protein